MWEIWEWNGHYIQGKLRKKNIKSKQSAIKDAKKNIKFKRTASGSKNELFLEDENGMPVGIIIRSKKYEE